MRHSRIILAGSILGAMIALPASAADIYNRGGASFKDVPPPAVASGFYVVVRGGATFAEDTDFDLDTSPVTVTNEYDDTGYTVSGAVGYEMSKLYGGAIRAELELGYFENEIEAHKLNGARVSGKDAFGETSAFYGLANLYYDFASFGRIKPFVGAGIGFANVEFDGHGVTTAGVVMDDEDTGFAYQLSAGANIGLTSKVDLEIGYRFLGVTGVELDAVDGTTSDIDVDNHIIYGGLKFKL
jgi:opacity protein-like surface antigen